MVAGTRVYRTTGRSREGEFESFERVEGIEDDQGRPATARGSRVFPHTWGMVGGVPKECDRGMML
jgi:hypothetical protein